MTKKRDHGGGIDAAIATYGGARAEWLDLSTGINPVPYPLPRLPDDVWTALPDQAAFARLYALARSYWNIPKDAAMIGATGASAIIAALPHALSGQNVHIPGPTYNEHGAAFQAAGWIMDPPHDAMVAVHPNNPDGHEWPETDLNAPITIIDESFGDVAPDKTLIHLATRPGTVVLKSFGKFWGLAGLRLGFAIGDPTVIAKLTDLLGPWQISGPALAIGAEALADPAWADETRARLAGDADRLDQLLIRNGAEVMGGTTLFRLYKVKDARAAQRQLAQHHVWSRTFPYAPDWLRLGLPAPNRWAQLEAAF
ncbi:threonine-phosphate decarboxylase [Loktanella sp. D2R18]|uniref:threonine-phosphate decarboxylase n=1 Tax=Rhodobacterales TaxID=204455 RepID=UPI000DE8BA11|nr:MULTISPECIES: threonine-phosphate decarboxylase [Rhodobacterales]MDO6591013.1 pyridoxal phosphate-dependent class II aminotransferase [Yoonia sp. 1_MG-2023]RBW42229.1 threonine-phosphate decarboxylase [Loktanella sp. D2R18]